MPPGLGSGVLITSGGDGEMMDFEKALGLPNKQASASISTTKVGSSIGSEENYIRITQTVDQLSADISRSAE
jgi:hypothetical protein